MKTTRAISLLAIMGAALTATCPEAVLAADNATHDHNHAADSTAKSATAAPVDSAAAMQQMRAAHEKMMAAKTPTERQAAMKEHDQAMRDGMKAMHRMMDMKGANDSTQGMQSRMDMMTMMMQMMMDRQSMGGHGMRGPATSPPPAQ